MISASMLSCYSALSSRILITNHLAEFSPSCSLNYHTYCSFIGAVYVFRACALSRISSPLLVGIILMCYPSLVIV